MAGGLEAMLGAASAAPAVTPYCCAEAWAAAMPASSRAVQEFRRIMADGRERARCARRPLLGATAIARRAKCTRLAAATPGAPCWGVADNGAGSHVFCYWTGAHFWARSPAGIVRVHPARVRRVWSVV